MMDSMDDTGYWSDVAAEELAIALDKAGIGFASVDGGSDGDVSITFNSLADAEALMTLTMCETGLIGGLYDRATSGCLTMADFVHRGYEPTDEEIKRAVDSSWTWTIHPAMSGRSMGWHVHADMPAADANQVTANLNALRLGGAL